MRFLKNQKGFTVFILLLNISILLVALVYGFAFKKTDGSIFICKFHSIFGLYCMGCGGSRALVNLLKFNLLKSFIQYPPILITVFLLLWVDTLTFLSAIKKDNRYIEKIHRSIFIIIPASIILNFVVKNIFLLCGFDLFIFAENINF